MVSEHDMPPSMSRKILNTPILSGTSNESHMAMRMFGHAPIFRPYPAYQDTWSPDGEIGAKTKIRHTVQTTGFADFVNTSAQKVNLASARKRQPYCLG
jgi:hypothetical protein